MEEVPGPCVEADRMIGSRARAVPVPLLLLALAEDPDAWKWRPSADEQREAACCVPCWIDGWIRLQSTSTDGFASKCGRLEFQLSGTFLSGVVQGRFHIHIQARIRLLQ